ncbi:MAG: EAL domain-containing protein [Proteobacteria bacterium]|nr:EAL domain-containing protein [Pseudomonadota bacterium]
MDNFALKAQSVFNIYHKEVFLEILTSFLCTGRSTEEVINDLVLTNEISFHDIAVLKAVITQMDENFSKQTSINIHGRTIDNYEQLLDVMHCVSYDSRKQLIIEITEDYVSPRSREFIKELKALGFKVALDDINKSKDLQKVLHELTSRGEQNLIDFVKLSCGKESPIHKSDDSCEWQLGDFKLNFNGVFVFENIDTVKKAESIWKDFPTALIQGYCFGKAETFISSRECAISIA